MWTCILCRFDVVLDDVLLMFKSGRAICLACYQREVDQAQPMPAALRRAITAAMDAA